MTGRLLHGLATAATAVVLVLGAHLLNAPVTMLLVSGGCVLLAWLQLRLRATRSLSGFWTTNR